MTQCWMQKTGDREGREDAKVAIQCATARDETSAGTNGACDQVSAISVGANAASVEVSAMFVEANATSVGANGTCVAHNATHVGANATGVDANASSGEAGFDDFLGTQRWEARGAGCYGPV